MNKIFRAILLTLAAIFLFSLTLSCSKPSGPLPSPSGTAAAPSKPEAKAAWEKEWQNSLDQAAKEKKVAIYSLWNTETRVALTKEFKSRHGIELEFTPFGRGTELLARVKAENRAGLYLADIFGAGGPTLLTVMKPEGVVGEIGGLLVLPEVLDGKYWPGGKILFSDKERSAVAMTVSAQRFMVYNTGQIKEGELTSYKDVLKPQYKGKIALNDPTVTGAGNAFFSHLAHNIWSVEEASDFIRKLIVEQEAVVIRDNRLHVESVAHGKYAIGLGARVGTVAQFLAIRAPIAPVMLKEVFISHADGVVGVPRIIARPGAARVFVNWLLSQEGQSVFAKNTGNPSLRLDVSTEGIEPIFLPSPDEKLFFDSEEQIIFRGQMLEVARDVLLKGLGR